jgi:hypothetical protein
VVADLARDVRFHYFDEPLHEQVLAEVYAEMEGHLDDLAADPARADRSEIVERLVWCPQPLRGSLLRRWTASGGEVKKVLLDVQVRRFYRIRAIHEVGFDRRLGVLLCMAEYEHVGGRFHVVTTYTPLADLPRVAVAVAAHLSAARARSADHRGPVHLASRETRSPRPAAEPERTRSGCDFGRSLHRLDVAVTSEREQAQSTTAPSTSPTVSPVGSPFVEDRLYRNLHP